LGNKWGCYHSEYHKKLLLCDYGIISEFIYIMFGSIFDGYIKLCVICSFVKSKLDLNQNKEHMSLQDMMCWVQPIPPN
jgi:hypothetical protein